MPTGKIPYIWIPSPISGAVAQQDPAAAHQQRGHDLISFPSVRSYRVHSKTLPHAHDKFGSKSERLSGDIPEHWRTTRSSLFKSERIGLGAVRIVARVFVRLPLLLNCCGT
jgi:hypothetical protein